jgi:glutamate racemase
VKVGVFDSGVGGITVLTALRKLLPAIDFVYLGDTANVPYGTKSSGQVVRLSLDAVSELRDRGVGALVVACNTASSVALPSIESAMRGIPVLGVVEPGAEAAVHAFRSAPEGGEILILATRATVRSGAYRKAIEELAELSGEHPPVVDEQECPLLVPMIEEGWLDHPILAATVREYVSKWARSSSPGVALLGCTHYPWIQTAIERALPGWTVVNSAQVVAEAFRARLGRDALHQLEQAPVGAIEWLFTDPHAVPAFAQDWISKA